MSAYVCPDPIEIFFFLAECLCAIKIAESLLGREDVLGLDVGEPGALEGVLGRDPLGGVELEHEVEQVEGRRHHERELFADAAPVQLLGLEGVEEGQVDDLGPNDRARRAARPRYQVQLVRLRVGLEYGLLREQLA